MKIAVFISGFFRDAPQTRENYQQFLDRPDDEVDFYVGTWSNYDIDRNTFNPILKSVNVETVVSEIFGDRLKGLWVGDLVKFENGEAPHPNSPPRTNFYEQFPLETLSPYGQSMYPWQQRVFDQWYTVYETYKLCQNYDSYDLCIRLRGDMTFLNKPLIPFDDIRDGIHVNGFWLTRADSYDDTGLVPFRVSEQLGWGKPRFMRKYFEYYTHFMEFIAPKLTLPDNKFHFGSEHMFAYYLLRYPYFKTLDPNNIHDHDLLIYIHGHTHTVHDGLIDNDYYTLTAR
jgi:hypothetical protein